MNLVLQTILPVTILMAFGFLLGQLGLFNKVATAALVRFSVTIVVPVAIFLQVIQTSRAQLSDFKDIAMLVIALLGMYALGLAVGKFVLGNPGRESIVEAACVSYPNLALLGLPIYQAFVGPSLAAVFVGVGNIITSLTIVPFTMAILASSTRTAGKGVSIWSLLWGGGSQPSAGLGAGAGYRPGAAGDHPSAPSARKHPHPCGTGQRGARVDRSGFAPAPAAFPLRP
jgi:predicted permease